MLTVQYQVKENHNGEIQNWLLTGDDRSVYFLEGTGEFILTGPATGFVLTKAETIPTSFNLSQNYPNPFNPVTSIGYNLPEEMYVTISVHNLIGQKIVDLVSEVQQMGHHEVVWDSQDAHRNIVSSGVYIYSITAGEHTALKKMILMR
jgi:hypothetical protein